MGEWHGGLSLNGAGWQLRGFRAEGWRTRRAYTAEPLDAHGWLTATVPGSVQHDLWQEGEIADPYFECNTRLAEWVSERAWVYRRWFTVGEAWRGCRAQLCLDGIDYAAHIFLNGEPLGTHSSMFVPACFEVGERLRIGGANLLAVVLDPAPHEQPQEGRTSLVRTGKTRMNYGWDFCPRLIHLGLWDTVALRFTGSARIEDMWVRPRLSDDWRQASVRVALHLSSTRAAQASLAITLRYQGESVAQHRMGVELRIGNENLEAELLIQTPHLWWPNGYGAQPLYQADVRVLLPEGESDRQEVTFGVRQVQWVANETPDPRALPYTLVINGRRIYIKGWNWVPMDVLYGVERPAKQERLLHLAQRAHVNLLRLNGVGLIERRTFYELCDQLGILIWQEFILSSSAQDRTPSTAPAYLGLLQSEAKGIVPRRRNHPSLVLWGGGNELESADFLPLDDQEPAIAAQRAVVARLDPDRHWVPTSASGPLPFNGINDTHRRPLDLHDVHGPWHFQGLTAQATLCNEGVNLLHSEFGVEGLTNLATLETILAPANRWPVTPANATWAHLGAEWWVREADWQAIWGEIGDLPTLVRATQFLQAEGVRYTIEANRRRKYQNSGSLPWQFNEPYPMGAGTSAVDYYTHPKPLYFAVTRAYAPLAVTATFPTWAWAGRDHFEAQLFALHSHERPLEAHVEGRLVGSDGAVYQTLHQSAHVQPNHATPLPTIRWPLEGISDVFMLDLTLTGDDGSGARNRYVFSRTATLAPLLALPPTPLDVAVQREAESWQVTLTNIGPQVALFVWLELDRDAPAEGFLYLDDNHLCLLPGEQRTLHATWDGVQPEARQLRIAGWNTGQHLIELAEKLGRKGTDW